MKTISSNLIGAQHSIDVDKAISFEIANVVEIEPEIAQVIEIRPDNNNNSLNVPIKDELSDEIPVEVIDGNLTGYITTSGVYDKNHLPAKYNVPREIINDIVIKGPRQSSTLGKLLTKLWDDVSSSRGERVLVSRPVPHIEYGGQQMPPAGFEIGVPVTVESFPVSSSREYEQLSYESINKSTSPNYFANTIATTSKTSTKKEKFDTKPLLSLANATNDHRPSFPMYNESIGKIVDAGIRPFPNNITQDDSDQTFHGETIMTEIKELVANVKLRVENPASDGIQTGDVADNIKEIWN